MFNQYLNVSGTTLSWELFWKEVILCILGFRVFTSLFSFVWVVQSLFTDMAVNGATSADKDPQDPVLSSQQDDIKWYFGANFTFPYI